MKTKKQFLIFVLTGGIAALSNILSRLGLSKILQFELAIIIAYLIGMFIAYILAKKFVFFNSKKSIKSSLVGFTLINLLAIMQTWLVSIGIKAFLINFVESIFITELVAHTSGVIVPVFTSFFGHKYISFNDQK
tara:strand:- start:222 stop:623 length:402 start_codon:yes stop_codon:yes gene_type:complete